MRRQIATFFQYTLTFALALGIVLSANARIVSHQPTDRAQIAAQEQTTVKDHGHDHHDVVEVADAYHGHPHDMVDHDHGVAVLPQRGEVDYLAAASTVWIPSVSDLSDHKPIDFDRPPRG
jgi:hypothetical protein